MRRVASARGRHTVANASGAAKVEILLSGSTTISTWPYSTGLAIAHEHSFDAPSRRDLDLVEHVERLDGRDDLPLSHRVARLDAASRQAVAPRGRRRRAARAHRRASPLAVASAAGCVPRRSRPRRPVTRQRPAAEMADYRGRLAQRQMQSMRGSCSMVISSMSLLSHQADQLTHFRDAEAACRQYRADWTRRRAPRVRAPCARLLPQLRHPRARDNSALAHTLNVRRRYPS